MDLSGASSISCRPEASRASGARGKINGAIEHLLESVAVECVSRERGPLSEFLWPGLMTGYSCQGTPRPWQMDGTSLLPGLPFFPAQIGVRTDGVEGMRRQARGFGLGGEEFGNGAGLPAGELRRA